MLCCAAIFPILRVYGEGPDREITSRRQPGPFYAIAALIILGIAFAVAALVEIGPELAA